MNAFYQLEREWRRIGSSEPAGDAIKALSLTPTGSVLDFPYIRSATLLLEMMHTKRGPWASDFVNVMLKETDAHPLIPRILLQALVPGLVAVGQRLRWGAPEWEADDYTAVLTAELWVVIGEWGGTWRQYAAGDLLNAVRMRLRRQLLKRTPTVPLGTDEAVAPPDPRDLLRIVTESGLPQEQKKILLSRIAGFSFPEISIATGLDRHRLLRGSREAQTRLRLEEGLPLPSEA